MQTRPAVLTFSDSKDSEVINAAEAASEDSVLQSCSCGSSYSWVPTQGATGDGTPPASQHARTKLSPSGAPALQLPGLSLSPSYAGEAHMVKRLSPEARSVNKPREYRWEAGQAGSTS